MVGLTLSKGFLGKVDEYATLLHEYILKNDIQDGDTSCKACFYNRELRAFLPNKMPNCELCRGDNINFYSVKTAYMTIPAWSFLFSTSRTPSGQNGHER